MTYSEKLRDPRWQKKRLYALDDANWTCQECKSKDITLNVHHLYYISGRDPWDYEDTALLTLCELCHKRETFAMKPALQKLDHQFQRLGFLSGDVDFLAQILATHSFPYDRQHHRETRIEMAMRFIVLLDIDSELGEYLLKARDKWWERQQNARYKLALIRESRAIADELAESWIGS